MSHKHCVYSVKIYYQQFYSIEANLSDSALMLDIEGIGAR